MLAARAPMARRSSTVDRLHHPGGIARAGDLAGPKGLVERLHVGGVEADGFGGDILLEIAAPLGPRNRRDIVALVQEPGERDLTWLDLLRGGDLTNDRRGALIGVEVLALVARIEPPVVALRIVLGALCVAGQEAAAERRKRNEADPELAQDRNDVVFEIALP